MYIYLGAVFLSPLLILNPSLYTVHPGGRTQPPYKVLAKKQRTPIRKGGSVFGDKGVDNNNSHVIIG